MKRNKFLLIAVLILVFSVPAFLSACGFISYNKGQSQSEKEYQQSLTEQKQQYIEKLENLSSQELYFESDVREYILCLAEGKNQINDCETIEELEGIFKANAEIIKSIATEAESKVEYSAKLNAVSSAEIYRKAEREQFEFFIENGLSAIDECKDRASLEAVYIAYKSEIENLKTAAQYEAEEAAALASYKDEKAAEICAHVNLEDYRAEERQAIENALENYSEKIAQSADYSAIDNFVREYKIEIYHLKTHAELYAEELSKLKADEIKSINNHVKLIDYRYDETLIIQTVIDSFTQQIENSTDKESVISLSENCKLILDGVKNDKTLYEEEKVSLAEERYEQLLSFAEVVVLSDEDKEEYIIHCDGIKADMLVCQSKREVNQIFIYEKKQFFEAGAIADDLTCLNYYQDALIEEFDFYLDVSLYRMEQSKNISRICDSGAFQIRKCSTYSATMLAYDNTIAQLDGVLTNDEMWEQEDNDFRALLNSLYGENILAEPESLTEADDYFELAKIIDYYAFYQKDWQSFVRNTFRVKINWEHRDAVWERNEAYWYCELLKSAVDIKAEFEGNSDYLVITLIPYHFASISNASETKKIEREENLIDFDSDKSGFIDRDDSFNDFPYYNFTQTATVWNSQQLWYALEYGYVPDCVADSPAENILNSTKRILRQIIKEGMSDEEKIFRIYSWFGQNVQYDHLHMNFNYSSDADNLPNEVISSLKSHFIEGAIDDGLAVCIGYAKTYLLMLRIEGIDARYNLARMPYMSGVNSINSIAGAFHAYVLINIDGGWYYSDPQKSFAGTAEEFSSLAFVCLPKNTYWFVEVVNRELPAGTSVSFYEYFKFDNMKIYVKSKEELYVILDEYSSRSDKKGLTLLYDSNYMNCYDDLISYQNGFDVLRTNTDRLIFELIISKI